MSERMSDDHPTAPDDDLAAGTEVENFRIECTLGRGGMSTVYGTVHGDSAAEDKSPRRTLLPSRGGATLSWQF